MNYFFCEWYMVNNLLNIYGCNGLSDEIRKSSGNLFLAPNRSDEQKMELTVIGVNLFNLKAVHDDGSESMLETLLVTGSHLSVSKRYMMIDMNWYVRSPAGNGASFFQKKADSTNKISELYNMES